jgi:hypothetical protein
LRGHFKEAVRRTKAFDALMRTLVVVVFDPEPDAFPGRLEAFELGAGEELLPNGLPKALDLAERHGMVWTALEVSDAALLELGLKAGGPPPCRVLAAIVSEHLLGRIILTHGSAEHFQDILSGLAAEDIGANQEPGIIIHETNQVGIAAAQPKGEDIRLPHLVWGGSFEEAGPHQITPGFGWTLNQVFLVEGLADGLGTGF